jgi:HK97 family phage portal protein
VGFLESVLGRFGYMKARPGQLAPDFMLQGLGLGEYHPEIPDYSLWHNQASLYQKLSWVNIATTVRSQAVAGARFSVKQLSGEEEKDIPNHPFELLLRRPNPLQSRFEILTATEAYRLIAGNAYWWVNRPSENQQPSEIWIIPPYQIKPIPDDKLYLRGYLYDPMDGTRPIPLETWEIVHFKAFHPVNRFVGMSAIEAFATVAVGDIAMQKWNANFFGKDNAKPGGILAFADPIDDGTWAKMKRDAETEFGGTANKRIMRLRNVGKGGVEWMQLGVNQKDMEFLNGRNFNKEEIYSILAPGLSSVLAVNATEANSVAGKATLNEFAVWPSHQAIAEKITNDLLPAYGENLTGEFDDVRMSDRAMELKEQETAFKVITVKEAREKYYQLPPLGDERDDKLVEGVGLTPEPLAPSAASGQPPTPPKPDAEVEGEMTAEDMPDAEMKADLAKWQRKALKRIKAGKSAAVGFESEEIPESLMLTIKAVLENATTVQEVFKAFEAVN